MSDLTLVIGNRNYSSWSLRPWILIQHLGLNCREIRLALDTPTFAAEVSRYSPTRRVPVLVDGTLSVWESTAILEYISELAGGRGWPSDRSARAIARAATAEMHAGFVPLRNAYPMNIRARGRRVAMTAELAASIARLDALWTGGVTSAPQGMAVRRLQRGRCDVSAGRVPLPDLRRHGTRGPRASLRCARGR